MSWYLSLPPAEASVPCGAGTHAVRWETGRLVLPAHPDAEAELVLAALGGDKVRCVEVAETWARHVADLDVLMTGPRSLADKVTVGWDEAEEHRATWFGLPPGMLRAASGGPGGPGGAGSGRAAWAVSGGPGANPGPGRVRPAAPGLPRHFASRVPEELARRIQARLEVLQLLALGPGLQFRLAGTVAASWAAADRQVDRSARRPELVAALTGRCAPAVADWLGIDPDAVTVTLAEPQGPAGNRPPWGTLEVSGRGDQRRLRVSLPIGWLSEVWACGLAVVDRHLVVAVETPGWPAARVLALPSPGCEAVALDVLGTDDGLGGLPRWEIARGSGP